MADEKQLAPPTARDASRSAVTGANAPGSGGVRISATVRAHDAGVRPALLPMIVRTSRTA